MDNFHSFPNVETIKRWYIDRGEDGIEIANRLNLSVELVYNKIVELGFPIRTGTENRVRTKAQSTELSEDFKEMLNGLIFGDGHINSSNICSGRYEHSDKHLSYIQWLIEEFEDNGIKCSKPRTIKLKDEGIYWKFYTYSYMEFAFFRRTWYRGHQKIFPNIELTPTVMLNHYIGDGSLRNHCQDIVLCVNGFTYQEVNRICDAYRESTQLDWRIRKDKDDSFVLGLYGKEQIRNFLNIIGSCPIDCYSYKWEI